MGADKSAENTPNAPKFICLDCLPKLKSASFGVRSLCHPPIDDFMLTQVIRLHTFLESKKNNGISLYNSTSTKN